MVRLKCGHTTRFRASASWQESTIPGDIPSCAPSLGELGSRQDAPSCEVPRLHEMRTGSKVVSPGKEGS